VSSAAAAIGLGVVAAQARADLPRLAALTLRAAELPDGSDHPVLNVVLSSSRAVLAEMKGDPEAAVRAFEGVPIDAVPRVLSVSVHRFWMHCLLMAGRADDAVVLATRYLDAGGSAHSRRSSAVARWCAGDPTDYHDLFAALGRRPPAGPYPPVRPEPPAGPAGSLSARDAFVDQCFGAIISSSGGVTGSYPAPDPEELHNSRDVAVATNAAAAQAVADGDETGAAALIRRQLLRFPLGDALGECHLRRSLAVGYVLEPRLRARWDATPLGPSHLRIRDVARALVDARAGRPVCTTVDPAVTFCALPLPWSVELACRLVVAGNPGGAELARWLSDVVGTTVVEQLRRVEVRTGDPAAAGAAAVLRTLPIRPAATLRVRALGPLEFEDGAGHNSAPRRARVRQLLAALLLHRSMTREHIVDLFWPDFEVTDAQRNLRVTLTHLRRALDPDRARGQAGYNLRIVGETVSLFDSDALRIDLWDFDRLVDEAASARGRGDTCLQATLLDRAVRLWRGPPLDDLRSIADLEPLVQRIRLRHVDALLQLGELRLVEGRWQDAQTCAAKAVAEAPFDERAHRLALAAALQRGEPTAIQAAAHRVVAALRELGVPAETTTRVLLSGARQRLGVPTSRAAIGLDLSCAQQSLPTGCCWGYPDGSRGPGGQRSS
jgi:DNA-binding SARP family transcriptional activator